MAKIVGSQSFGGRVCSNCGETHKFTASFCRKCGASLRGSALTQEAAVDPHDQPKARLTKGRVWQAILGFVFVSFTTIGVLRWENAEKLPVLDGRATSIAVSDDGRYVAIGSERAVRLLDLVSGERLWRVAIPGSWVACLRFAPDGHSLAAASVGERGRLTFLDARTGRVTTQYSRFASGVASIRFNRDGSRVLGETGEFNSAASLFSIDVRGQTEVWHRTLPTNEHDNSDHLFSVSSDGQFIATGGGYGEIPIWSSLDGAQVFELKGHSETVRDVAYSADGTLLASSSSAIILSPQSPLKTLGTVVLWKVQRNGPPEIIRRFTTPIAFSIVFSPDGKKLLVKGTNFGGLYLYECSGQIVWAANWTPTAVTFVPNGSAIAAAGDEGRVELIDPGSGKQMRLLELNSPAR